MEETQNYLAGEKLGKLMRKYSIPCIISLLVSALYNNLLDQFGAIILLFFLISAVMQFV